MLADNARYRDADPLGDVQYSLLTSILRSNSTILSAQLEMDIEPIAIERDATRETLSIERPFTSPVVTWPGDHSALVLLCVGHSNRVLRQVLRRSPIIEQSFLKLSCLVFAFDCCFPVLIVPVSGSAALASHLYGAVLHIFSNPNICPIDK